MLTFYKFASYQARAVNLTLKFHKKSKYKFIVSIHEQQQRDAFLTLTLQDGNVDKHRIQKQFLY